ncbi:hypothetical protein DUNSADRAFT_4647 [Dunaliella salina]|uniref:Encoded protein n=1 Tax=Dunaliella salina TaxID=3046 RepID=A0ABZ3KAD5_DUNSA|nr:hypothetical protein DUNSADRAFT_4647 [Dunaliella salina]|eukprot:KAF5826133.1 hypothetical protein DUNSADRAFT_4647 [Dunaliella salina]
MPSLIKAPKPGSSSTTGAWVHLLGAYHPSRSSRWPLDTRLSLPGTLCPPCICSGSPIPTPASLLLKHNTLCLPFLLIHLQCTSQSQCCSSAQRHLVGGTYGSRSPRHSPSPG